MNNTELNNIIATANDDNINSIFAQLMSDSFVRGIRTCIPTLNIFKAEDGTDKVAIHFAQFNDNDELKDIAVITNNVQYSKADVQTLARILGASTYDELANNTKEVRIRFYVRETKSGYKFQAFRQAKADEV